MKQKRTIPAFLLAVPAALAFSACGGDGDSEKKKPVVEGGGTPTITSAIKIDKQAAAVTLPLYEGRTRDGQKTYYVVTDSSDKQDATERGVNFAPKLANALGTRAVQRATGEGEELTFEGTVDFSPKVAVKPGPEGFPPKVAKPGAIGDRRYSPLVTTDGETVINASQVANQSGRHDSVKSIDILKGEVTLNLLEGFVGGGRNLYLRTEASIELLAAVEASTFAPNLNEAPGLGSNAESSTRSAIIPIINGLREADDPDQRQGMESALLGEGPPLNIEQEPTSSPAYSPIWDVHPAVWSEKAIENDERRQLKSAQEITKEVKAGRIVSGGKGPANSSLGGLKAAEFISNCSIVSLG